MAKQLELFDRADILYITTATDQVYDDQCYNAVNHAITSIMLQAHDIPIDYVPVYLRAFVEMQFHLKEGFGCDEKGCQETVGNYFGCLGQSSWGAPLAWQIISFIMLGAYKCEEYGIVIRKAWSGLLFVVAAILVVDDCDLLHMCVDLDMSDLEFLTWKRHAMYYWAQLLMAMIGNLKDAKCSCYLLSSKFVQGEAKLCSLRKLPNYEFVVPVHGDEDHPSLCLMAACLQRLLVCTQFLYPHLNQNLHMINALRL